MVPLWGLLAGFCRFQWRRINRPLPDGKMTEIAAAIHEGAMAFISREYRTLLFVLFVFIALSIFVDLRQFVSCGGPFVLL